MADERSKALETVLTQLEKRFGAGAVMKLGDTQALNVEHIPSGSIGLDMALGIGGLPKGRITEMYGPESSGKTTLALHAVAEAQKLGGNAAYIDVEHALDPVYAENLGVNISDLLVSQPDSGEQALEIAESLIRSGAIDIIVIDSVAALVPKAEIEGDMGDTLPGLQARLMSQAMRKLNAVIAKSNCVAIFINQLRLKIGVMFGNPETTTGGNALKFYASVRLDIRRTETIKNGQEMIGSHTRVKIVKNKVSPPFKTAEFDIMYGTGISRESELVALGEQYGVLVRQGAWYYYDDQRIAQGKEKAKELFKADSALAKEVEEKIIAAHAKLLEQEKAVRSQGAAEKPALTPDPAMANPPSGEEAPKRKKINIDVAVDDD